MHTSLSVLWVAMRGFPATFVLVTVMVRLETSRLFTMSDTWRYIAQLVAPGKKTMHKVRPRPLL